MIYLLWVRDARGPGPCAKAPPTVRAEADHSGTASAGAGADGSGQRGSTGQGLGGDSELG